LDVCADGCFAPMQVAAIQPALWVRGHDEPLFLFVLPK
jgi:hypothetical protein